MLGAPRLRYGARQISLNGRMQYRLPILIDREPICSVFLQHLQAIDVTPRSSPRRGGSLILISSFYINTLL